MLSCSAVCVSQRLWLGIGSQKLEQETTEGTHAQELPAYQRRA